MKVDLDRNEIAWLHNALLELPIRGNAAQMLLVVQAKLAASLQPVEAEPTKKGRSSKKS